MGFRFRLFCHQIFGPLGIGVFYRNHPGLDEGFGMERSKFTDTQKALVVKQDEEGTPVAEIVYAGPQPNHFEGSSFKGGFGGKGGGTNARTTSPQRPFHCIGPACL